MIAFSEEKYIPDLKILWKKCFPKDSDAFIDSYYQYVYKDNETLLCLVDDKPVAALQIVPYPIKTGGNISLAGYISGAMTDPDFRRKGYMAELLNASFTKMAKLHCHYTFLIPQEEWLFGFYEQFGYVKAFPHSIEEIIIPGDYPPTGLLRDKEVRKYTHFEEININDFFVVYSRFLMEQKNVILKTKQQLAIMLNVLFMDGGALFVNDWGCAFVLQQNERVIIKEAFYFDTEIQSGFIQAIKEYYETSRLYQEYYNKPGTPFRGMIRNLQDTSPAPSDIYMSQMLE